MQLGERVLNKGWNDTLPAWNWGNNIDWLANKIEFGEKGRKSTFRESFKHYEGHEFRIAKRKFSSNHVKIRIEIRDFDGQAKDIIFPDNSERYNLENWFNLQLS